MKKWICLFLALLTLCGCTAKSESAQTDSTTLPSQTEPAAEAVETQPPETEAPWSPYTGTSKGYVYCYPEGRDRDWEEDVIYVGDNYLKNFHALTHFPSRIQMIGDVEYTDEFYDPDLRQSFIDQLNELILQIPQLSDTEILYELQRILALLKDVHTGIDLPTEDLFPIGFEVFFENDELVYRVTYLPSKYEYAMFARLVGINNIPLDEIIERMKPYLPHENQYCLAYMLSGNGYPGWLSCRDLLLITGVIDDPDDAVRYNLQYFGGVPETIKLKSVNTEEFATFRASGWTHAMAYPDIYGESDTQFYFYKMMPEADMLYVRFNEFSPMPEYPILNFGNDILREVRDTGGVDKLVVDLRRNPGGAQTLGFPEFITILKRLDVDQIYVLTDQGTFSCAIIMASQIKQAIPEVILMGTPAGQAPNFYAGLYENDYTMPNSGITCNIPTAYYRMIPDYAHEALMPDIPVYPTLEDYAEGIDTVLEAVKKH